MISSWHMQVTGAIYQGRENPYACLGDYSSSCDEVELQTLVTVLSCSLRVSKQWLLLVSLSTLGNSSRGSHCTGRAIVTSLQTNDEIPA